MHEKWIFIFNSTKQALQFLFFLLFPFHLLFLSIFVLFLFYSLDVVHFFFHFKQKINEILLFSVRIRNSTMIFGNLIHLNFVKKLNIFFVKSIMLGEMSWCYFLFLFFFYYQNTPRNELYNNIKWLKYTFFNSLHLFKRIPSI